MITWKYYQYEVSPDNIVILDYLSSIPDADQCERSVAMRMPKILSFKAVKWGQKDM